MPSCSYASAFLNASHGETNIWLNERWQEITHVTGTPWEVSDNLADDARAPFNASWTAKEARAVAVFAKHHLGLASEGAAAQDKFLKKTLDADSVGRDLWMNWIAKGVVSWRLNSIVDQALKSISMDPKSVIQRVGTRYLPILNEAQAMDPGRKAIAFELLGEAAFDNEVHYLKNKYISFFSSLMVGAWSRHRKMNKRDVDTLGKDINNVNYMWTNMTKPGAMEPTLPQITSFMKQAKKLVERLSFYGDAESAQLQTERLAQITQMGWAAVKDEKHIDEIKKLPKVIRDALQKLASKSDIDKVNSITLQTIEMLDASEEEIDIDFNDTVPLIDWSEGTENYHHMTSREILTALGCGETLPYFQSRVDYNDSVNPQTPAGQAYLDDPDNLERTELLVPAWHQLVGIYKMVDKTFDDGGSQLLMDSVGVGKTMQVVGYFCVLAYFREYFATTGHFPGVFKDHKCTSTGGNLPDLPFLVVVPSSLLYQWKTELGRYLRFGAFDILPYTGTLPNRRDWWNTVMKTSQQGKDSKKIILATSPAIQDDAKRRFEPGVKKNVFVPRPLPYYIEMAKNGTVYTRRFLGVAVDELHAARRSTNKTHMAYRALRPLAHGFIGMTATPITTSPVDLWSLGQILDLNGYDDVDTLADMDRELRRAARIERNNSVAAGKKGAPGRAYLVGLAENPDAPPSAYEPVMLKWVKKMREDFADVIIRRTIDSVNPHTGLPISGLEPWREHILELELYDWELEIMHRRAGTDVNKGAWDAINVLCEAVPSWPSRTATMGRPLPWLPLVQRPPVGVQDGHGATRTLVHAALLGRTASARASRTILAGAKFYLDFRRGLIHPHAVKDTEPSPKAPKSEANAAATPLPPDTANTSTSARPSAADSTTVDNAAIPLASTDVSPLVDISETDRQPAEQSANPDADAQLPAEALRRVEEWKTPESREDWESSDRKSIKLDILVQLVLHHLEHDSATPLAVQEDFRSLRVRTDEEEDGAPRTEPIEGKPDKIIVYSGFPSSNHIIGDVFDVYGIKYLECNGEVDVKDRAPVLDEFRAAGRDGPRVLILSGAGMFGLNLADANIMIMADTCWSAQDDEQLRGRIYRRPQNKIVQVYRLIALHTPDVFLNTICFGKAKMHAAFVNAPTVIQNYFAHQGDSEDALLSVNESDMEGLDDSESEAAPKSKKPSKKPSKKAAKKKGKQAAKKSKGKGKQNADESPESEEDAAPPPSKPKGRKKDVGTEGPLAPAVQKPKGKRQRSYTATSGGGPSRKKPTQRKAPVNAEIHTRTNMNNILVGEAI
ncbi:hypothetical protein CONPUDRAFT_73886 [Coniophora puteana RWD-64-598 SS2]|uniref:Helicase C-terminal domain-containing protein n=1 Tax=Coniophora puteana (strain RWD-64-598) TaxID=741705 RepID=A0A5M3MK90_CONPW|nr:uncharacterized protein CONPUDRAFT_73886 [Coniophora puteana RWD-64-598 SS2]EIW79437.1 hypothetical protein CONPUDRAFT_73886 [Coniophora puteana RWD-64-598 SS2]